MPWGLGILILYFSIPSLCLLRLLLVCLYSGNRRLLVFTCLSLQFCGQQFPPYPPFSYRSKQNFSLFSLFVRTEWWLPSCLHVKPETTLNYPFKRYQSYCFHNRKCMLNASLVFFSDVMNLNQATIIHFWSNANWCLHFFWPHFHQFFHTAARITWGDLFTSLLKALQWLS